MGRKRSAGADGAPTFSSADVDADVDEGRRRAAAREARRAAKKAAKKAQGAEVVAEAEVEVEVKADDKKARKKAKGRTACDDDDGAAAAAAAAGGGEDEQAKRAKKKAKTEKQAKQAAGSPEASETAAAGGEPTPNPPDDSEPGTVEAFDTFDKAPFSSKLLKSLKSTFDAPTPIQAQAWPTAVSGKDLIAVAKTGSGKTLGFLLPALHAYANKPSASAAPRVLVMAPTRELALQIHAECAKFGALVGCKSVAVYGGAPWGEQLSAVKLDNPTVVVATPGRLCDFLSKKAINLSRTTYVVLDEADRMLDMGFEPQIRQIFAAVPKERQTLFFTATWPKSVRKLASTYLRAGNDLKQLFIGTAPDAQLEANKSISQRFVQATDDEKDDKMYKLLCELEPNARVVVFANTKRRVEACAKNFQEFGTVAIHGDKQQTERDRALAAFTRGDAPLMFATDVAARGLDIKGVTHVMNFDMARDVESYVHRIGRTGRAGELGESITFWNPDYDKETTAALCKIARDAGQEVPEWLARHEKGKVAKTWRVDKINAAMASI